MYDEEEIVLYLPFPPTLNSYYGCNKNVKYVRSAGKKYKQDVRSSIVEQLRCGFTQRCPINIELIFHMPDDRTRDLDNFKKALLDSCTRDFSDGWEGLWEDDGQIDQDFSYRGATIKGGLVIMKVNPAGPIIPLPQHLQPRG